VHELSIATSLLELCERELRTHGDGVLERVRVAVGELSAVEPELLRFAWQGLLAGTRHDGCVLEIEWHPAVQRCDACGVVAERQPGSFLRLCPTCELPLRLEGGGELDLMTLTILEPEVNR